MTIVISPHLHQQRSSGGGVAANVIKADNVTNGVCGVLAVMCVCLNGNNGKQ